MKWKLSKKKTDHINVQFSKKMFLLCPYEEMFLHFKLHMEIFSCFVRRFYFLLFLFNKQTKQVTKNRSKNVKAVVWYCYF